MSFFDVLNTKKKVSPEQIATEIKALQQRIPELDADYKAAERAELTLRQKRLGGSNAVAASELEAAERVRDSAGRDCFAAQKALQELESKLRQTIEENIKDEGEALKKQRIELLNERWKQDVVHAEKLAELVFFEETTGCSGFKPADSLVLLTGEAQTAYYKKLKQLRESQQVPTLANQLCGVEFQLRLRETMKVENEVQKRTEELLSV
ncbi:MAG: hypothetical protein H7843_01915 [Nitrospirota bacterium]